MAFHSFLFFDPFFRKIYSIRMERTNNKIFDLKCRTSFHVLVWLCCVFYPCLFLCIDPPALMSILSYNLLRLTHIFISISFLGSRLRTEEDRGRRRGASTKTTDLNSKGIFFSLFWICLFLYLFNDCAYTEDLKSKIIQFVILSE